MSNAEEPSAAQKLVNKMRKMKKSRDIASTLQITKVIKTKGTHSIIEGVGKKGEKVVCRKENKYIPVELLKQ